MHGMSVVCLQESGRVSIEGNCDHALYVYAIVESKSCIWELTNGVYYAL